MENFAIYFGAHPCILHGGLIWVAFCLSVVCCLSWLYKHSDLESVPVNSLSKWIGRGLLLWQLGLIANVELHFSQCVLMCEMAMENSLERDRKCTSETYCLCRFWKNIIRYWVVTCKPFQSAGSGLADPDWHSLLILFIGLRKKNWSWECMINGRSLRL